MRIILDGTEITATNDVGPYIENTLKKENRVIKSITVNGIEAVNHPLEAILADSAAGKEVIIETADTEELIAESMHSAIAYLPKLRKGLPVLRDYVLEGKTEAARQRLDEAVEGLEWLLLVIRAYVNVNAAEDAILTAEEYNQLNAAVVELENSIQAGDFILICDIFEYEIVPLLAQMEHSVNKIIAPNEP